MIRGDRRKGPITANARGAPDRPAGAGTSSAHRWAESATGLAVSTALVIIDVLSSTRRRTGRSPKTRQDGNALPGCASKPATSTFARPRRIRSTTAISPRCTRLHEAGHLRAAERVLRGHDHPQDALARLPGPARVGRPLDVRQPDQTAALNSEMLNTYRVMAAVLTLLGGVGASASEQYSVEQSFKNQVNVPSSVALLLGEELNLAKSGCPQSSVAEALEATEVKVGSAVTSILVKPTPAAFCLCGAYYCPAWLFAVTPTGAKQLWFTAGTSYIEILNSRDTGYRRLRSGGGAAGQGLVESWIWSNGSYRLSKTKRWTMRK